MITILISESVLLNKTYKEDFVLLKGSSLKFHGILQGNVNIKEDSSLYLNGIINGDIIVESNCNLHIHGILNGDIINHGHSELYGILNSTKPIPNTLIVHKDSIINNIKQM